MKFTCHREGRPSQVRAHRQTLQQDCCPSGGFYQWLRFRDLDGGLEREPRATPTVPHNDERRPLGAEKERNTSPRTLWTGSLDGSDDPDADHPIGRRQPHEPICAGTLTSVPVRSAPCPTAPNPARQKSRDHHRQDPHDWTAPPAVERPGYTAGDGGPARPRTRRRRSRSRTPALTQASPSHALVKRIDPSGKTYPLGSRSWLCGPGWPLASLAASRQTLGACDQTRSGLSSRSGTLLLPPGAVPPSPGPPPVRRLRRLPRRPSSPKASGTDPHQWIFLCMGLQ